MGELSPKPQSRAFPCAAAAYAADRRRSPFGAVRPGGLEARGFARLESFAFARRGVARLMRTLRLPHTPPVQELYFSAR
ncbi:MAG: hypothetical protein AAFO76_03345 [Cyanobacteria bacterium J06607_15]